VGIGPITQVAWDDWFDGERALDPYLVWADITRFAGFGGFDANASDSGGKLPFLVETTKRFELTGDEVPPACAVLDIPGVYVPPAGSGIKATRFFTARVNPLCVKILLQSSESIERFQLGIARIPSTNAVPVQPQIPPQATTVRRRPEMLLAVIDDTVGFLHPCFAASASDTYGFVSSGGTRVLGVWQQEGASGDRGPPGLGYGYVLGRARLAELSQRQWQARGTSDVEAYVDARHQRAAWSMASHGSGVAHLAAGNAPGTKAQGVIGKTGLLFVQMPARSVMDTSGGSLSVHLLDALRYVEQAASAIFEDKPRLVLAAMPPSPASAGEAAADDRQQIVGAPLPLGSALPPGDPLPRLVAVVSFGSIAGPHDGSSMIERAMAELIALRGRMAIVVAAGNAHGSNTHAVLGPRREGQTEYRSTADPRYTRVQPELRGGESHEVTWQVPPDNPNACFLEIWLPEGQCDAARITLQPPGMTSPCFVPIGRAAAFFDTTHPSDVPMACVIFARRVAQGQNGTMVLIAVGSTRPFDPLDVSRDLQPPYSTMQGRARPVERPTAPSGDWLVTVSNAGVQPMQVHLWTERNDLVGRHARRQQARLADDRGRAVQSERSLATLAGGQPGQGVYVVTGYRQSDGMLAAYASGGPGRGVRTGPDVEAPSDRGVSMPGVAVPGIGASSYSALGGTSAAAPQFARWLVENWSQGDTPKHVDDLIARSLAPVQPRPIRDNPPWPDPLPLGSEDTARRGKFRL
jgi:hypothetical protein